MVMKETPRKRLRVPPKSATFKEKLKATIVVNNQVQLYIDITHHDYQRFNWVDQLLGLNFCLHGNCPDGEGDKITRFENRLEAEFSNAS